MQLARRKSRWATIETKRLRLEFQETRRFYKMIMDQLSFVRSNFMGNPSEWINQVIINDEITKKTYADSYAKVGKEFAASEYLEVTGQKFQKKDLELNWEEWMRSYALNSAGTRIVGVDETTRQYIRTILAKAAEDGLSIDDTQKLLTNQFEMLSRSRSRTIARTEIVSSSNMGSLLGAKSTGLTLNKIWISTFDSRTRDTHLIVDGEETDIDGTFNVAGENLSFAGDPTGSPGNVINCRCTIGYKRL